MEPSLRVLGRTGSGWSSQIIKYGTGLLRKLGWGGDWLHPWEHLETIHFQFSNSLWTFFTVATQESSRKPLVAHWAISLI